MIVVRDWWISRWIMNKAQFDQYFVAEVAPFHQATTKMLWVQFWTRQNRFLALSKVYKM